MDTRSPLDPSRTYTFAEAAVALGVSEDDVFAYAFGEKIPPKETGLGVRWEKPWLVQRLRAPDGRPPDSCAFGAGNSIRGGFTAEGLAKIDGVLRFDYMGAAQYESGAVPGALAKMWDMRQLDRLVSGSVTLRKKSPAIDVHYLCADSHPAKVEEFIRDQYRQNPTIDVRDWTRLRESIEMTTQPEGRPAYMPVGWLELKNPFAFFIDETMYERMKGIYDLK